MTAPALPDADAQFRAATRQVNRTLMLAVVSQAVVILAIIGYLLYRSEAAQAQQVRTGRAVVAICAYFRAGGALDPVILYPGRTGYPQAPPVVGVDLIRQARQSFEALGCTGAQPENPSQAYWEHRYHLGEP